MVRAIRTVRREAGQTPQEGLKAVILYSGDKSMTHDPLVQRVATRFAAEGGGSEEFIKMVESNLSLQGRRITFDNESRLVGNRYDSVFVNFINLPTGKGGAGGGAEAENNRMSFTIEGFGKDTPHSPPPTGKVKIEMRVSALPREYKLRGKTGTPAQVAKYLADFLNKVVKEVEPRFTHSQ